jgi:acyl phosphate:glycerol-3-phosphate acyltransferase
VELINSLIFNHNQPIILSMIFWGIFAYLLGSIPFSYLVTSFFRKSDILQYGDGNPGAYNAWHVGGWKVGLMAVFLDFGKGFFPIFMAQKLGGLTGWAMVPIALAPILGHARSPFLKFHKGKAVATTLGVWLGLTGISGIVAFAIFTITTMLWIDEHAWNVIFGMIGIIFYCIFLQYSAALILIAALNLLVLAWTHQRELRRPIQIHDRPRELIYRWRNS